MIKALNCFECKFRNNCKNRPNKIDNVYGGLECSQIWLRNDNLPELKPSEVYAGKITISRATSNVEDDYINIEIRADSKRIQCKMSMESYAFAISGLALQPIDVEFK